MPMTGTLSPSAADGIFRRTISRGCCVPPGAAAPAAPLLSAMAIVPRKYRRFMVAYGPERLMRVQYCPSSATCSVNCLKSIGFTI